MIQAGPNPPPDELPTLQAYNSVCFEQTEKGCVMRPFRGRLRGADKVSPPAVFLPKSAALVRSGPHVGRLLGVQKPGLDLELFFNPMLLVRHAWSVHRPHIVTDTVFLAKPFDLFKLHQVTQ